MRMTMSTASTMTSRIHRKGFRTPSKRHPGKALPGKLHAMSRVGPGKLVPGKRIPQRPHPPPCDNSNDSGFGFDPHVEVQHHQQQTQNASSSSSSSSSSNSTATNLSTNNSSHHHHNQNGSINHHSAAVLQHSPQQHLIRAIPSSRSAPAKKLPFVTIDDENDDFSTDDSDDFYMHKNLDTTASIGSSTSSSSPTLSARDFQQHQQQQQSEKCFKRRKLETTHVELDNDDACSEDAFIRKVASAIVVETEIPMQPVQTVQEPLVTAPLKFMPSASRGVTRVANKRQPATPLNTVAISSNSNIQLEIISQPEQQHRARYQTEGSRGAVKDRSGNGFPIVRLTGYNKPAVLQVFIGTDIGRVAPHMFYQACKVAGKNSTQCSEKKVDGTMVIEIDFKPETDMTITCDCVGILKERNVDVEHRFPDNPAQKNKKKSTRCRMVFRTLLSHDDGSTETLQVCSNPIICTQPPGVPEICKKSLNSCPVEGGLELFIIGKNFLKDTRVIFQETYESVDNNQQMIGTLWEQTVLPDKEYLQQTHLICTVPPYQHQNILKPITVQVSVISSGKKSESHAFVYTPKGTYTTLAAATSLSSNLHGTNLSAAQDTTFMDTSSSPLTKSGTSATLWPTTETKHEIDADMMPPPITTQMPMGVRRPSLPTSTPMITDQLAAHLNIPTDVLKTEMLDETSQGSIAEVMHSPEAANSCGPLSPTALQYHSRYGRKASLESMMYESNSLPGFPVNQAVANVGATNPLEAATVAAVVEMAVQNNMLQNQQQQVVVAATNSVDSFITELATSNPVTIPTAPVNTDPTLFGAASTTVMDILQSTVVTNQPSPVLERSLSISSNSSNHSSSNGASPLALIAASAGTSPANSITNHNSPITTQDILLNSEPAATLNSLQQLLPTHATAGAVAVSPIADVPTILCSANGNATAVVPNIMAPHQVTMANSILNDFSLQPQPTEQDATVAALALSNIIRSPTTVTDVNNAAVSAPSTAATSTAVSNMIIKAAADFISNQEQQQHHHHQQPTPMLTNTTAIATTVPTVDPLVNLLLNPHDVVTPTAVVAQASAVVAVNEVQSQFPLGMPTSVQQESPLIVALAAENALQKSVATAAVTTNGAIVTQQTATTTVGVVTAAAAGAVPLPPPIPQELTTMSDQDLISFINPSTFDQI